MKKLLALCAVAVPTLALAAALSLNQPYMTVGQQLSSSVTLIDMRTGEYICSGFIVAEDRVLTAKHCVNPVADGVRIQFIDGHVEDGLVLKRAEDEDVALLAIDTGDMPIAQIQREIQVGDAVCAVGVPFGLLPWSRTCGFVSAKREEMPEIQVGDGKAWIQVDAPIAGGNSGGGVYAVDGGVIGIVSWGFVGSNSFNFLVPIHNALKSVGIK